MSEQRRLLTKKRRNRSWKCRIGIHHWGETQLVSILTIRDQCQRCGMARYFNGALNEVFYRQEAINDDE